MSNYTKGTDFASKDSLLTGDPNKIVRGSEIDDEFNAIQVAVNSKANTNSPTLTGTPLSTTAAAGTNTTQIATTAFVTAQINTAAFSIEESGTNLLIKYNGTAIAKISSTGAITAADNVTAYGTV